jgi:hypothetical protein
MNAKLNGCLASFLCFALTAPVFAASAELSYSGRAVGAIVLVDSLPAERASDTGELPSTGGTLETSADNIFLNGVFRADFASAQVYSNANGVISFAQAVAISMFPGEPAALTASSASSQAFALCGGTVSSTSVADLVFGGVPIQLTGPNQVVTIPGVGTLTIHERIDSITPTASGTTVNALHLVLAAGGEVVVASTHADVSNCATAVTAIPWSNFKALYR